MSILAVNNISVSYPVGDFQNLGFKEYLIRKIKNNIQYSEFTALDCINFTLESGDMLGIVGANGAGKSTLLKVVTNILTPSKGQVSCNAKIAALLELGTGFDGELSVRENTYLRGALLGYSKEFMNNAYDNIIEFSELQDFQERPFKHLSSGMKSRLAFSIASLIEPELLILDEVLAVGDGSFRKKSEDKMKQIISSGATTILVTHSIPQVRRMCNKVLWLDKGNQIAFGETEEICDCYELFLKEKNTNPNAVANFVPKEIKILKNDILNASLATIDEKKQAINLEIKKNMNIMFDINDTEFNYIPPVNSSKTARGT